MGMPDSSLPRRFVAASSRLPLIVERVDNEPQLFVTVFESSRSPTKVSMDIPWIADASQRKPHVPGSPRARWRRSTPATVSSAATPTSTGSTTPVGWTASRGRSSLGHVRLAPPGGRQGRRLARRPPGVFGQRRRAPFALHPRGADAVSVPNADADEILFVHQGAGRLETDFGPLAYEPGDYLLLPAARPTDSCPPALPGCWSSGLQRSVFPEKGCWASTRSSTPRCCRCPRPSSSLLGPAREWELRIRHCGQQTKLFYPFNPHDVVGWKGTLATLKLNVRDIRPVSSDRYHLPPSAHTTFVMRNAVVCNFLPRPLENGDPRGAQGAFYHSNIDFDEVLFTTLGISSAAPGIAPGMLHLPPQRGIHHGPQQKAFERSRNAARTEEVAVMVTRSLQAWRRRRPSSSPNAGRAGRTP